MPAPTMATAARRSGKCRTVVPGHAATGCREGDVAPLVVHSQAEARFSDTIEFRDDLDFGPNVQRIGDYLREQDQKLRTLQDESVVPVSLRDM